MKKLKLQGTFTALITPFNKDLSVDFESLISLVEHQVQSGVDGLVVLGSTAESQTLEMKERIAVMLKVQEAVNGRIPIIVGAGSNDTRATIEFTMLVKEYGFSGVLLVAPYYNKPSQEGLFNHFLSISEAVDIPQIIYNVPSRTGVNITADTCIKIAMNCKNVIGVKEASGDLEQMMEIIHRSPEGFNLVSGDDALALPIIFAGAKGVISVLSNYAPKQFSDCIRFAIRGKIGDAVKSHYNLFELMQLNFIETNPVPVKAFMKELGLINTNLVRLPLVPITEGSEEVIKLAIKKKEIC
ncbi:MAG: 4-hydroxy-tetrahydrodipicolinate synthase [Ignavibacteria bacterium]|nr:4-hydroxy-tetrahydrodipicolinate synthase [Ignavibacteria bacterium]